MAELVQAQLAEDGTYPGVEGIFAEVAAASASRPPARPHDEPPLVSDFNFDPAQLRDPGGRWTSGGSRPRAPDGTPTTLAAHHGEDPVAGGTPNIEENLEREERVRPLTPVPGVGSGHRPGEVEPVIPPPPVGIPPSASVGPPGRPRLSKSSGAPPGVPNPPTALNSIEVPPGLTLKARGETIKQRADDYAEEARKAFGFDPASPKNKAGETWPAGLREDSFTGLRTAIEVKYLSPSGRGLRDPNRDIPFINQKDVGQAGKYIDKFKGGLLWVTNNKDLSDKYDKLFKDNGLSGVRVVYIPSKEE